MVVLQEKIRLVSMLRVSIICEEVQGLKSLREREKSND